MKRQIDNPSPEMEQAEQDQDHEDDDVLFVVSECVETKVVLRFILSIIAFHPEEGKPI